MKLRESLRLIVLLQSSRQPKGLLAVTKPTILCIFTMMTLMNHEHFFVHNFFSDHARQAFSVDKSIKCFYTLKNHACIIQSCKSYEEPVVVSTVMYTCVRKVFQFVHIQYKTQCK